MEETEERWGAILILIASLLAGSFLLFVFVMAIYTSQPQLAQVAQAQRPEVTMEAFQPHDDFIIANEPMLGLGSTRTNIVAVIRKRDRGVFYALAGDHPDLYKPPYLRGRSVRLLRVRVPPSSINSAGTEFLAIAY